MCVLQVKLTFPPTFIQHNQRDCGNASWAISYTVAFASRIPPLSTEEAQIGLPYTVEKRLFRLNFSRPRVPTGGQSKSSTFWIGSSSQKPQSKRFHTRFVNRSHRLFHHQTPTHTTTRPHTHTRYHTAVSYKAMTRAWLSLLLLLAVSQRGAILVRLASSVYHTTAAACGIDLMLPTTAAPAVALAALG